MDEDELGWYYQVPMEDPELPGFTFMDRAHRCPSGEPHAVELTTASCEKRQGT